MNRKTQIHPSATIASEYYSKDQHRTTISFDNQTQDEYLNILKKHVSKKFCYHSDAALTARIIETNLRVGYQVEIWTLMEKRWTKTISVPYNGEETPGQNIENMFDLKKYNFKADSTIVKDKETEHITIPETQKKTVCVACNSRGKRTCEKCNGVGSINENPCSICDSAGSLNCSKCSSSGFILHKTDMYCERYTVHSATYPKNTFLPDECIQNSRGKFEFFNDDILYDGDSLWSNFESLKSLITGKSPYDFCKLIERQFKENHLDKLDKTTQIRRVKCSIQRVDIIEVDYQAGHYINKGNARKGISIH